MEMVKLFKLFVFFQIYFNVGITIFFRFYRPWAIFIILDALGAAYAMNVLMAFPLLLILIIKSTVSMIFPSNYRIKIFCAISRNFCQFSSYSQSMDMISTRGKFQSWPIVEVAVSIHLFYI